MYEIPSVIVVREHARGFDARWASCMRLQLMSIQHEHHQVCESQICTHTQSSNQKKEAVL